MADDGNGGSLLDGLRFDPAQHPDARVLTGFSKKSTDGSKLRLYLTLQLNEYVEFATADVLDLKSFGSGKRGPTLTVVWLKGGTIVQEVRTVKIAAPTTTEGQAAFVRGGITDQYLSSAEMAAAMRSGAGTTRTISVFVVCYSAPGECAPVRPTQNPLMCPTSLVWCGQGLP